MSKTINLAIAGMTFCVNCQYPYIGKYAHRFLIDSVGDHTINMTQADIDYERQVYLNENSEGDENLSVSPDYFLEVTALLRKVSEYVVNYNRILMHGSAIAVNGKGYIFTALSGTGKSTHTALLRKLLGENAVMVNDDKPFLAWENGKVFVCGTPWMGKHKLGNNISVPLEGIFFLHRSAENELQGMEAIDALPMMLAQCHRPPDAVKMMTTLDFVERVLHTVPLYNFGCNMDISAAELSSSVMK